MHRIVLIAGTVIGLGSTARAAEVVGRVEMPAACSPEVSPAVVRLEPAGGGPIAAVGTRGVTLEVSQKMLQFRPRVQGMATGQTLRFTNGDAERHNVHIQGGGVNFSRTIGPGEAVEFTPDRAGLLRLFCDIHVHMRGFVVVSASPWVAVCDRTGAFRLAEVPEGRYTLHVWHEVGESVSRELTVGSGRTDVGTIRVEGPRSVARAASEVAVEPWAAVVDRVSVSLAAALEAATRKGDDAARAAVGRVDEAYFLVFEGSDMETAVRSALGYDRAVALERQFLGLRREARALAEGRSPASKFGRLTRELLQGLLQATLDLNARGLTDRSGLASLAAGPAAAAIPASDRAARLLAVRGAFDRVAALAGSGRAGEAATELVEGAYFEAFEPLERDLNLRNPSAVKPLESRFASLRGRIDGGLEGAELESELDALHAEIRAAVDRAAVGTASAFGLAFFASLVTILREGVEVILLLTMLAALVAKAGRPRGAVRALWWGVGLAVAASLGTAFALAKLVGGAGGRAGELIEGFVMLAAAGVLFYVSYWLISQSESRRWMEFLRRQAARGSTLGGFFTLGLAAFLAVYREGAETALMYQALIASTPTPQGLAGLAAGLGVGVVVLAILAVVLRLTSVRLPMRLFFQATGLLLFAMAVVFAGHGVLGLQVAGLLKNTPVGWLGRGVPALGLHPSTQGLAIQGLLALGAVLALGVLLVDRRRVGPPSVPARQVPAEPVGVGARS